MDNQIKMETLAMIDNLNQYLNGNITDEGMIEGVRDYYFKLTIG
jgi:hypothetical protein